MLDNPGKATDFYDDILGDASNHPMVMWKGYMPRDLGRVYRCVDWNAGYDTDHSKIEVHDSTSQRCKYLCNYMLQRNSAFARLNQITRVKLAERSPRATYWETWNLEAECLHVSGATFDGTHHGWWVERAKAVQILNHL